MSGPSLSQREAEMLRRVANGETYREVARNWGVEEITARTTGVRVMRKLGANTITHAVFLACRAGLLDGRPQERHGDRPGFRAHERRGEEPCEACKAGEAEYRAEMRRKRRLEGSGGPQGAQEAASAARVVRGAARAAERRTGPRGEAAA